VTIVEKREMVEILNLRHGASPVGNFPALAIAKEARMRAMDFMAIILQTKKINFKIAFNF
jgi:hypothetical protein